VSVPLVHAASTWFLVGLIWVIQVVHYPLFAGVGPERFVAYEQAHTRRISFVVGPPMAVEGVTALWLVADPPPGVTRWLPAVALAVLGVVHLSTVALQVPSHGRLASAWDADEGARLVRTNWIRTVGWSVRGLLASWIVAAAS